MRAMEPAPIALFAYNRPDHLERTLRSLRANDLAAQSALTIFSDGPRGSEDESKVAAVRAVARTAAGFAAVHVVERSENMGGPVGIPMGISEVCSRAGRVIVVEDDLEVSPGLLGFLNDGLRLYADETAVAAISGFCFPHTRRLPGTFFLRGAFSEGWATWDRSWSTRDDDPARLRDQLMHRGLAEAFDLRYGSWMRMLEPRGDGRPAPWDVRWHASAFLDGKLTLLPNASLVRNTGFDGSGTNVGEETYLEMPLAPRVPALERIPVAENRKARDALTALLRSQAGWRRRIQLTLPGGYRRMTISARSGSSAG